MVKHFKRIIAISVLLFILLMTISGSFAHENQTDLGEEESVCYLSESVDIYFDASAADDGDGSRQNPYNTMDSSKLKNNSNIYFEDGDYILESEELNLENVNIFGKNPEKTSVYAHNSNWDVVNVNARGTFAISNITIKNMHFNITDGMTATNSNFILDLLYKYDNGGAISSGADTFSTININGCKFYNYTACFGGAVLCDNGILNVEKCEFYNNYVFPYQYVLAEGGAILIHNSTAKIRNSYFKGNTADYSAGAISNILSNTTVFNCTFIQNEAQFAGALSNQEGNLTVEESTFENNAAGYGAIKGYLGVITVTDSIFKDNHAKYSGGAICAENTRLDVSSSKFINNSAKSFGGSVYALSSKEIKMSDDSFENDSSSRAGGSIFAENSQISLTDITVNGAKSLFGAAIGTLNSNALLKRVSIDNCRASYYGGAIYGYNGCVSISNSNITQNTADRGGALYINNAALSIDSANIINNAAQTGTAGYLFNVSESEFKNLILKDNEFVKSDSFEPFYGNGNYTLMKGNDTFNGNLPSRYNSAELGYVTPVSDQLNGDYCWAFSTIAVLESCIAKATGLQYDFSENNLINLNKKYSSYGLNVTGQAGNAINALGYLLSWLGPVNENDDAYDVDSKISPVLNSLMHVQNVLFLDMKYDDSDRNSIKEAIMRYGAVGTSIYWMQLYPLQNSSSYYHFSDEPALANHAITLVGWDDNYSKDNFGLTPPGDGAWICKNTWGTGTGDHGYFYISYYCNSLNYEFYTVNDEYMNLDWVYTIILNDTIRLDKNYQYDYAGPTDSYMFLNGTAIKNAFKATEDEYLAAVSTYFLQDTAYEIGIYVNGELVHTQSSTSRPGYYTINLERIIPLKANDTFEVAFKMSNLNGDYFNVYVAEKNDVTADVYRHGVSYVLYSGDNGDWYDVGNSVIFSIKAFTIASELKTSLSLNVDYNNRNPVNITATVLDEYGRRMTYGNVTFTLEGKDFTVNVTEGVAKMTHNFKKGESVIRATFSGSGYESSSAETTVDVYKQLIDMTMEVSTDLNTAVLNFTTSEKINSLVEVLVNNKSQMAILMNGKLSVSVKNLIYGENEIIASLYDCQDYDAQVSRILIIEIVQPKIVSHDFETYENSNSMYSVKLLDDKSNPISGKTIIFNLNGRDYEATTNNDGEATLPISLPSGDYMIKTIFEGEGNLLNADAENSIKVKKLLGADVDVKSNYREVNVEINLSENVTADLKVDVNHITYDVSAADGKANLKLENLRNGDYNIIVYMDSDTYHFSNVEKNISIYFVETKIISDDLVTVDDLNDTFSVVLLDRDSDPIRGKTVKFNLNGRDYEVITNKNGEASIGLDVAGGNYVITTSFEGDELYMPSTVKNNIKIKTNLAANIKVVKKGNAADISLELSKDVDIDMILNINGKNQTINSKETLKLENLTNRDYNLRLYLSDEDYIFRTSSARFFINAQKTKLQITDTTVYAGTGSKFTAKLLNQDGEPIAGQIVRFTVNGMILNGTTDKKGIAAVSLVNLSCGNCKITADFDAVNNYLSSSISKTITVKTTVALPSNDVYTFNSPYSVKLYDNEGKSLSSAKNVEFNINGQAMYAVCINGIASLNIGLDVGNYIVKVTNPQTGEMKTQSVRVIAILCENKSVTMYYGGGKSFRVKVLDDNGNAAVGVLVNIQLSGKTKQVKTDSNGYAKYKITSKPGKYTIKASYKGFEVSDKVTVKSTIVTKNIAVKKGKTIKFTAKLLNSKGKILKYKKVTFKFIGKTYKIKTDKKGIATLKVTKKLKIGKYVIKTTYGKLTISNKITVKK